MTATVTRSRAVPGIGPLTAVQRGAAGATEVADPEDLALVEADRTDLRVRFG